MEPRTDTVAGRTRDQAPRAEPRWPLYVAAGIMGGAFSSALLYLQRTETFTPITFGASLAGAVVLGWALEALLRRVSAGERRTEFPPAA